MYKTLSDLPQWVHDYHDAWCNKGSWPLGYKEIVDEIRLKADEVFKRIKLPSTYINPSPYSQGEIDNFMGVKDDFYESYPVLTCSEGFRPDEWDLVYDSPYARGFTRGDICETKIGNWYFLMGFDFD